MKSPPIYPPWAMLPVRQGDSRNNSALYMCETCHSFREPMATMLPSSAALVQNVVTIVASAVAVKDCVRGVSRYPTSEGSVLRSYWIGAGDRFEFLQPACETICQVKIAELVCCNSV